MNAVLDAGERAHAAALAGLNAMTPKRLSSLLRRHRPSEAWEVAMGRADDPVAGPWFRRHPLLLGEFRTSGARRPPDEVWDRCRSTGTSVLLLDDPEYPACLRGDPEAPAVLFARGDPTALDARRAGIVGTRNATDGGRRLATRLGRELAQAGITVVSGLARGIDGCAHRGVLAASPAVGGAPVAVVASGPDHPFPREHRDLWEEVVDRGLLVSEHPPGAPPLADWFPLRNRILAALSEVLVVVESRERGGSLVTARMATERQIPVLAVPGSLLNRAAEGTNRLIADGSSAVLDSTDVLIALGLETKRAGRRRHEHRPRPSSLDRTVLDAFAGDPLTLDHVVLRTGLGITEVALAVGRLEAGGWLASSAGWYEPVGAAAVG